MKTMKTLKVYEWLLDNNYMVPATAMVRQFPLLGNLEYDMIEQFLDTYFKHTAPRIFREMQCAVTTTLHFKHV